MKKHLFFFTIGPVQGFIAQARKTHDLFAGSALLSALTQTGISEFLSQSKGFKGEIILPFTYTPDDKVPNRFVGALECEDTHLKSIGENVQESVKNHLSQEFDSLEIKGIAGAKQQIENLLEIYWLFIPLADGTYQDAYNQGDKMLGAIKNLRAFNQYSPHGEKGRKCVVDGERNVIVYRKVAGETNTSSKFFSNSNAELGKKMRVVNDDDYAIDKIWDIQQGEGISAVTYLKRKYLRNPHMFPSTAAISLLHLKRSFLGEYDSYEKYVKATFGHTNDQLFYTENINKRTLKPFTGLVGDDALNKLHEKLEPLKIKAEENNLKFLKYYALISFDGDNMGEWFSGENLKNPAELLDFHKMLSQQLYQFAHKASDYLNKHGKTVFAGEDFLGFINLLSLFEAVKELRRLWKTIVNDELGNKFEFQHGKIMTFSAGIVIAHYKQPLGMVLKQVREAASEAKKGKKNSFTLVAMKHSGNTLKCTYPFESGAIDCLIKIRTELESNFSSAFISKYNQSLAHLGNEIPEALVARELKTNISRACKIEKQPGDSDEEFGNRKRDLINELVKPVNHLVALNLSKNAGGDEVINEVSNLTQTFAILDFLKRKTN